jgi:hypothetical protein
MKTDAIKEIVKALMESKCYFELTVKERLALVVHVLQIMGNGPNPAKATEQLPL